ncbi:Homeobox-like_domain superfamily [Hexamita inflata]|uniref:Homeobox-like domain superfamily n=1 Tax=Hexamita inflata TaxID=28002 RepID=A0AA86NJ85_9EUKA|nr:Homeobox-like domain superfamily [Hexamita inflata]
MPNILFTCNMKHIQWEAVQKRMQLPLKECRRVWKYVSHQIKTSQPIFSQNEANLSQYQDEPSDLNRSDLLVAQSDAPQVQNSQVLLQSSEEKLLQLALSFHGPEWDYIQRKYLPMRTLKQLKQSYQLMRKNALVKLNQVDRKEPHDSVQNGGARALRHEGRPAAEREVDRGDELPGKHGWRREVIVGYQYIATSTIILDIKFSSTCLNLSSEFQPRQINSPFTPVVEPGQLVSAYLIEDAEVYEVLLVHLLHAAVDFLQRHRLLALGSEQLPDGVLHFVHLRSQLHLLLEVVVFNGLVIDRYFQ